MNAGVRYAVDAKKKYIVTDWKATNLSASQFWPKYGFTAVAYELVRKIDSDYVEYFMSNDM